MLKSFEIRRATAMMDLPLERTTPSAGPTAKRCYRAVHIRITLVTQDVTYRLSLLQLVGGLHIAST